MAENTPRRSLIPLAISTLVCLLVLVVFGKSYAAGLLKPKTGGASQIAIKSHNVRVVINNGFARTEVDQVFINTGDVDLEAVYSFPLPKKASLSELSLWIDGNEVIGEVLERQQAENLYEDQKSQGKETAIARKNDFKTFDINVFPVKAAEPTRVRLVYYQPLAIDQNIGRYVYPLAEGGVDDERISFWSVDDEVKESFSFDLVLKSTQPVKDVRLPGHPDAIVEQVGVADGEEGGNDHVYHVQLAYPEGGNLNKDIIFYYRLDDTVPARVEMVSYKDVNQVEGTFMLTITPGASLSRISEGVDWVFVLDRSGSMGGGKIEALVDGVTRALGKMSPVDRFRIVIFNDTAQDLTNGFLQATPEAVRSARDLVSNVSAQKGTALYAGIDLALQAIDSERTTSILLVTDGVANVGPSKYGDFMDLLAGQDVRLFTFVMGNSANEPLLQGLANVSGGFALNVSLTDDIFGRILQAKNKVLFQALHNVKVRFSGGGVDQVTPVRRNTLYQGEQLVLFGKYQTPGPVSVTLEAKISGTPHEWTCGASLPQEDTDNPEIERLWALSAIEDVMEDIRISGESETLRGKVVHLGEEYSLVTDYTSMVVLDETDMEEWGIQRKNSERVYRERAAQTQRQSSPVKSYRVDNTPDGGMFKGARSPGVGTGPVGPWFLIVLLGCGWLARRKKS